MNKKPPTVWEIPPVFLPLFLRIFFGFLLVFTLFRCGPEVLAADFSSADYLWPVAWMALVPASHLPLACLLLIGLSGTCLFLGITCLRCWWFRVFGTILSFSLFALMYSFGKVDNNPINWPIAALILAWCRIDTSAFWRRMNAQLVLGASRLLLTFYFLSGLSKILSLASQMHGANSLYDLVTGYLPRIIGGLAINGTSGVWVPDMLVKQGALTGIAFLLVLIVQLGSIFVVFRPAWFRAWGLALICFHLTTAYFIDINFQTTALLIIVLLVAHPLDPAHTNEIDARKTAS